MVTVPVAGGSVRIEPLPSGKQRLRFTAEDPAVFCPRDEVETGFPVSLLSELAVIDGSWVCEVVARHEQEDYVLGAIKRQVDTYFNRSDFAGKRLLDFGCGAGASTLGMSRLFPKTEIVGVELSQDALERARLFARYRDCPNVEFHHSPSGSELPAGIGQFDFIMLSAVWEHLLPAERPVIAGLLWKSLKPGGHLLLNQTPYRWSPYEHHTTGTWLINYLPDRLALYVARNFSTQTPADLAKCDWPELLRRGIRGGTEGEVLGLIRRAGGTPVMLQPRGLTRAQLWLAATSPSYRPFKKVLAATFGVMDSLLGTMPVIHLEMVIRRAA